MLKTRGILENLSGIQVVSPAPIVKYLLFDDGSMLFVKACAEGCSGHHQCFRNLFLCIGRKSFINFNILEWIKLALNVINESM